MYLTYFQELNVSLTTLISLVLAVNISSQEKLIWDKTLGLACMIVCKTELSENQNCNLPDWCVWKEGLKQASYGHGEQQRMVFDKVGNRELWIVSVASVAVIMSWWSLPGSIDHLIAVSSPSTKQSNILPFKHYLHLENIPQVFLWSFVAFDGLLRRSRCWCSQLLFDSL